MHAPTKISGLRTRNITKRFLYPSFLVSFLNFFTLPFGICLQNIFFGISSLSNYNFSIYHNETRGTTGIIPHSFDRAFGLSICFACQMVCISHTVKVPLLNISY